MSIYKKSVVILLTSLLLLACSNSFPQLPYNHFVAHLLQQLDDHATERQICSEELAQIAINSLVTNFPNNSVAILNRRYLATATASQRLNYLLINLIEVRDTRNPLWFSNLELERLVVRNTIAYYHS